MNDTQNWVQLEFEGVEAKGQPLPDGCQCRFLEAPELEERPRTLQTVNTFDSLGLGYREECPSKLRRFQIPRLIFEVDADPMCRRPRPEKTEPAGGETEPEIR